MDKNSQDNHLNERYSEVVYCLLSKLKFQKISILAPHRVLVVRPLANGQHNKFRYRDFLAKSIACITCFKLQLKMPANQATVGRLEAVLARLETVAAKLGIESTPKKGSAHSEADIRSLVERLEAAADKIEQQSSGAEGKCILCSKYRVIF